MNIITYLAFTFLSILIQFCVMDYIQEKIQTEDTANLDVTTQKQILNDLLKNISSKPHALYYRTNVMGRSLKNTSPSKIYNNSSMTEVTLGTTEGTTTIFDVLYDENTSETEAASETTTEIYSTSTEFENLTEITFFETKNKSSIVPSTTPKIKFSLHCDCNLLYKVCDINCCCDQDCSDYEHKIFQCDETSKAENKEMDGCISHILDEQRYAGSMLDNLFCVVKTNLPSKRSIKKYDEAAPMGTYFEWQSIQQSQKSYEFKKTLYKRADPIWLLKNGIIYYLDFPAPMMNNYCTDRVPIVFLKREKITCNVKFKDLEMFNILKTSEEAMVISATNSTFNSTALNCSNLHCINWTILACENGICWNYNKTANEASCTENVCTNIALKIDYGFYYYDMKIVNATIKLHLQNTSHILPLLMQEISVNFYLVNKSIDHVIELSGNPGYVNGLPVIASYVKNNHTDNFFHNTSETKRRMLFPENRNGQCVSANTSNNFVKFGINKRTNCRYVYSHTTLSKRNLCNDIHNGIMRLLWLNNNVSISPFGNPHDIADDNWINLRTVDENKHEPIYGEYNENTLKLYCYNLINRLSVTFMYANVDEESYTGQNKILSAKYEVTAKNVSFNIEDISVVITVDVNWMDLSKPSIIEYAGSPHINIHLPKDFFFPFPQNGCVNMSNTLIVTIYCFVIIFICK